MLGASHLLYQNVTLNCRVQDRLSHVIKIKGWQNHEEAASGSDG